MPSVVLRLSIGEGLFTAELFVAQGRCALFIRSGAGARLGITGRADNEGMSVLCASEVIACTLV